MNTQDKFFYLFILIGAGGLFLLNINSTSIHQHWLELCSYGICGIGILAGLVLYFYKNDSLSWAQKSFYFFYLIMAFGIGLEGFNAGLFHKKWLVYIGEVIILIGFIGAIFSYFSALGFMAQRWIDVIKTIFNWINPWK